MLLTRCLTSDGVLWAIDGHALPAGLTLADLLTLRSTDLERFLEFMPRGARVAGGLLAPIDPAQEVWAAGVTYLRSRTARERESEVADVYARVYAAERPELFFKAVGVRVVGPGAPIRIRRDSHWNVPEPEMTLVINRWGEIVGICAGNDVSSRDIEGANPLYLPQAKVYDGSCALGPGIIFSQAEELRDVRVQLEIERDGVPIFSGDTRTSQMARKLDELAAYLCMELTFPQGVFLMTGTGIVPPETFTLRAGDVVQVTVGELTLENAVAAV